MREVNRSELAKVEGSGPIAVIALGAAGSIVGRVAWWGYKQMLFGPHGVFRR